MQPFLHRVYGVKQVIFFGAFSIFESGGITKHVMTGPSGNSEFCFLSTSTTLRVSEKQNSLFPLWPVVKCLLLCCFNINLRSGVLFFPVAKKKGRLIAGYFNIPYASFSVRYKQSVSSGVFCWRTGSSERRPRLKEKRKNKLQVKIVKWCTDNRSQFGELSCQDKC